LKDLRIETRCWVLVACCSLLVETKNEKQGTRNDESSFWLEFIIDEQLMKTNLVAPLLNEAKELTAIFYTSRKTARKST